MNLFLVYKKSKPPWFSEVSKNKLILHKNCFSAQKPIVDSIDHVKRHKLPYSPFHKTLI